MNEWLHDNDYVFYDTSTERTQGGDPFVSRTVRIVVARRFTFEFTFGRSLR